ncbi:murein transglycosylase A [Novosphingobium sp. 1949]|uniref:peptidoglycan lytic exotransglycosylase n=1 Tax=Novosphingobium organovorum TaxID=2930092 RepID=A0ABT0BCP4_9SPHN|nr:murein transglycosylase A [Novosphingobium organovorum]MCJ2182833.1 murein transglycosylase A [Novosphingobium organovorum]
MRLGVIGALALLLAACAVVPQGRPGAGGAGPAPGAPAGPANALAAGIRPGPAFATLPVGAMDARAALSGFAESCPKLLARDDASGLTRAADWRRPCVAAASWSPDLANAFFAEFFETARVGDAAAFATGYYEPEIAGSPVHLPGYDVPIYGMPADLVRAREGDATPLAGGRMPLGRYDHDGVFVPYYDRGAIEDGALEGRAPVIAWAHDPVEVFFLQVQGSGMLRAPDGSVVRIGYAGQNGLPYTGIGKLMRERGLIGDGPGQYPGSMQGIMQYIRDNPEAGAALMRENRSFVFFRVLTGDGPLGALGVPVRGHASVAADPRFVPLGAPVWLAFADHPEANGLWVAQDTGGAIKGANRFDTFWGAGDRARLTAGGMSGHGEALVLLPKGTLARLAGER